ncbi:MAG TPA: carboxymuconolactone decarboxylase family protein [Galbitalea sp.]
MEDPTTVPLIEVPESARERLAALGAPPQAADSKLYRALANEPDLLIGWLEIAWRLRENRSTGVRLRELMIIRGAQLSDCEFELIGHTIRARGAGVTDDEIAQIANWRQSSLFTDDERLVFEFMEEIVVGHTSDSVNDRLAAAFTPAERIELILTASFYCMVPRTIDALRLVRDPD